MGVDLQHVLCQKLLTVMTGLSVNNLKQAGDNLHYACVVLEMFKDRTYCSVQCQPEWPSNRPEQLKPPSIAFLYNKVNPNWSNFRNNFPKYWCQIPHLCCTVLATLTLLNFNWLHFFFTVTFHTCYLSLNITSF